MINRKLFEMPMTMGRSPTRSAPSRYLKLDEVKARFGISHSTIYRWMGKGEFPKPVKLGAGSVRWPETELDRWAAERATTA